MLALYFENSGSSGVIIRWSGTEAGAVNISGAVCVRGPSCRRLSSAPTTCYSLLVVRGYQTPSHVAAFKRRLKTTLCNCL